MVGMPLNEARERIAAILDALDGDRFEVFCQDLLRALGFRDVRHRKGGPDDAIDLVADIQHTTWYFQCKKRTQSLSITDLGGTVDWAIAERPDFLVILSNKRVTPAAVRNVQRRVDGQNQPFRLVQWTAGTLCDLVLSVSDRLPHWRIEGWQGPRPIDPDSEITHLVDSRHNYSSHVKRLLDSENPKFVWTKLFVSVAARQAPAAEYPYTNGLLLSLKHNAADTAPHQISSALAIIHEVSHMLLLGDGGAGKSTVVCEAARRQARAILGGAVDLHIPMYVELSSFRRPGQLSELIRQDIPEKIFAEDLSRGRYLIFLDGLNEVPGAFFDEAVDEVVLFVQHHAKNRFVITSRASHELPAGPASLISRYELQPLQEEQVIDYLAHPFFGRNKEEAKSIHENLGLNLQRLASNPLGLMMIAVWLQRHKNLDTGVPYAVLLRHFEDWICRRLLPVIRAELLPALAYHMAANQLEALDIKDVANVVADRISQLQAGPRSRDRYRGLRNLDAETAIDVLRGSRVLAGNREIKFFHQAIREYYTACELLANKDVNAILAVVKDSDNSSIKRSIVQPFFGSLLVTVGLMENPGEVIKGVWARDRMFAIDCINIGNCPAAIATEITEGIEQLSESAGRDSRLLARELAINLEADKFGPFRYSILLRQISDEDVNLRDYASFSLSKYVQSHTAASILLLITRRLVDETDPCTCDHLLDCLRACLEKGGPDLKGQLSCSELLRPFGELAGWRRQRFEGIKGILEMAMLGAPAEYIPAMKCYETAAEIFGTDATNREVAASRRVPDLLRELMAAGNRDTATEILDYLMDKMFHRSAISAELVQGLIACFEEVAYVPPLNTTVLYDYGLFLQLGGRPHDAAACYEAIVAREPTHRFALINHVELMITDQDYQKAGKLLQRVQTTFEDDETILIALSLRACVAFLQASVSSPAPWEIVSEFLDRAGRVDHRLKAGWYHVDNVLPLLEEKLTADQISCVLKMIDLQRERQRSGTSRHTWRLPVVDGAVCEKRPGEFSTEKLASPRAASCRVWVEEAAAASAIWNRWQRVMGVF